MTIARYKVNLKDLSGTSVAEFDDWISLTFTHKVNGVGSCEFSINGDDDRISLFELDGQVEIQRNLTGVPSGWHTEWEGFHRRPNFDRDRSGQPIFTSVCRSYLFLISGRVVAYNAATPESQKSGVGETVIKEYVDENAGPNAIAPTRLRSGIFTGLTIEADAASGGSWAGERAYKPLLKTIQEIAAIADVDFNVVGDGDATFEFQVKDGQWGEDRSTAGLDPTTGLNGAGNAPVIFSEGSANAENPRYTFDRTKEANQILVLGQGVQDEKEVVIRSDATAAADSTWNDREKVRQGNSTDTTELETIGDQALEDNKGMEAFSIVAIQQDSQRYGSVDFGGHYHWGDLVTARRYDNVDINKKIISVRITVSGGQPQIENIAIKFGDL